jgi:enoyl-CoA hydratase/carnithine racemase
VVMDRPEQRNAVSNQMLTELAAAFGELADDSSVRAVILAGEGPDFCAGADFADLGHAPGGLDYGQRFEQVLRTIEGHPDPVIAEVQGSAFGAGCQIVVACDLAVVAEDARFAIPSGKLGIVVNYENIERLALAIGTKRAGELLYSARTITGTEAVAWGLANTAVRAADLHAETLKFAERVASLAPLSVRGAKRGVGLSHKHLTLDRSTDRKELAEFDLLAAEALGSEDLREGIAAFRERRLPEFGGK